ncbi:efflux transporter outer membrane subunit [Comamonas sp. NLF-1-9]|uniref:efflux transporter outer membrane subunit n=1 Tax=Comamonas sp. NLF-1-9 TaxID=2853163 RepID=UPI001C44F7C3|nr:efflux transporter outer membrane subunit [Comamonas sp. NLF-1-9]QXL84016.1 efflux transporter outer membrane subunit [Comamonas sp. NLF-1-9]
MPRFPSSLTAVLAAAALAGCASTTAPFTRPAAPTMQSYTPTANEATAPAASGAQRIIVVQAPEPAWWRALQSPGLDALIEQAFKASPTLAAAQALLTQAQARQQAQADSMRMPQVDAGLGMQQQRATGAAQGQEGTGREFRLYSASVGVRYQFDLSGVQGHTLQQLADRTAWRRHELDAARLMLAGQIAQAAITRARLAAQIEVSDALLSGQLRQLHLAHERQRLGQALPDEALALATQAEQTRASLPPLRRQLQQTEHLLALLCGQAPGTAQVPAFVLADFTLPAELPLLVPSALVRQRPDIQASEALLHAAHAEHGAAVARRYPQLTLSASLGSQALAAGALFGGASAVWALGAQLGAPLFNAAQPSEEQAAMAALDAASANYQSVVLQALREVADVLRAIEHDAQTEQALMSADASARQSVQLAEERLRLGAVSEVQLLIAQQQAQQSALQRVAAQAQRLSDSVALYQAIGAASARTPG